MEAVGPVGFTCKHCNEHIPAIDTACTHKCFINRNIYMDSNNVLFSNDILDVNDEPCNNSQKTASITAGSTEQFIEQNKSAVWTDNATMALLSLYEANMHMLDHPKKQSKIWMAISNGLKDFEIEMSSDQVRWKINILQKKYKECCDNNNKSGRGAIEFKWYIQLDEIFGKNKDAIAAHTVSSQIIKKKVSAVSALASQNNAINCTSKSPSPDSVINISTSPVASTSTSTASVALIATDK